MDTWGLAAGCDCDDTEPDTYPGAVEINDGLDNQCPGYPGHGLVDEIAGDLEFPDRWDKDILSWTAQAGATAYWLARSTDPESSEACALFDTTDSFWIDFAPCCRSAVAGARIPKELNGRSVRSVGVAPFIRADGEVRAHVIAAEGSPMVPSPGRKRHAAPLSSPS